MENLQLSIWVIADKALKISNRESIRALRLSDFETFRVVKVSIRVLWFQGPKTLPIGEPSPCLSLHINSLFITFILMFLSLFDFAIFNLKKKIFFREAFLEVCTICRQKLHSEKTFNIVFTFPLVQSYLVA